ncbi:hypothetical protein RRV45_19110 [Bacillus sp. DTU_2020_1000418_1_SI_GHA_SEK_038]|uniref:hypothetical protein n=1 Tax=Bacillus sp. DTU_2020_1000418_1_SI_GHA_SEK_038 TaxID=3077585 RepID=UPI0028EEBDEC|nr:hypothetical protein [Bacillus sp. DTU_2020_1000418_1_SI_GHA_SEK_038]WNS74966.1 hypothetical protein RRV45_19110 [Bacillus sp. DTU_2020_1000418_1_SI_GHA_SEK_038]
MPEEKKGKPVIEDFEVEKLFEDRPHERHAFSFKVQGDEYKGHYHEDEIIWLHPHPKQMIGESKVDTIEATIQSLMRQYGISSGIEDLELMPAFEDRIHERQAFTLQVQGEEFKGFVHKGEIQWFHPQPQQKLEEEHIEAIESEIHEKIAEQTKSEE